ncbi:glycoside hydrolase family 32 protein [Streptomyces canus]|uniref:glycoside hydrolase family 32 protein n=1 Tax=Streptomyces canus TaxID=58343 RepID=UPI000368195E|nr:glycoside hydrolase family 32 protein [Streptomyces canus]
MSPDPDAPRFRVRPPAHWINDPNGPFRWRGRYHLFYQYNPQAPVHANVHWGHASSPDLAHWEHHPVALTPTPGGPDEAGCWSGCVVEDDGVPTAVYTGVDRSHAGLGSICLAVAEDDDLVAWKPLPVPVVSGPPAGLEVTMFRDPFVFRFGGRRWALVGAGHADGTPSVLVYDCEDLHDWRFAGVLLDGRDPLTAEAFGPGATGWECPQLARTPGGEWVLAVALWDGDPRGTAYATGRLTRLPGGGPRFVPRHGGRLDLGRDFYAPSVLQDTERDRALLWGWSWEARPQRDVDRAGWAGVLTAPRVVDVHEDGSLRVTPTTELELLRSAEPLGPGPLPDAYDLTVTARSPATVSLLRAASGAELTVRLDPAAGTVTLDRSGWPRSRPDGSAPLVVRVPSGPLTVRVLVDGSLLELFAGQRAMVTERVYRRPGDTALLTVSGDAIELECRALIPEE